MVVTVLPSSIRRALETKQLPSQSSLTHAESNPSLIWFSIVFVHGLFGHPTKTWSCPQSRLKNTSSGSERSKGQISSVQSNGEGDSHQELWGGGISKALLWPQELLPCVIPKARIFTWGYDADVDGFMSSASQNNIHQHAINLLSDLADLRSNLNDESVPVIFVVHSLGGIVVKDALNKSSSTENPRLKSIAPATYGIVFLGTPHHGSKSASIGKLAYKISAFAAKSPNIKLFQALERNSETLDRIGYTFSQTSSKHRIQVISFREEKKTRKFLVFQTMVRIPLFSNSDLIRRRW